MTIKDIANSLEVSIDFLLGNSECRETVEQYALEKSEESVNKIELLDLVKNMKFLEYRLDVIGEVIEMLKKDKN